MIRVEYRGVDITARVDVNRCWIDQYAAEHGDTIKVIFTDQDGLWDSWSPEIGDKIRIYNDHADSGIQYVRKTNPSVGRYEIDAGSIPPGADNTRSNGWQQATKLQLAKDIADRYGLTLRTYGITDHKFLYLRQDNEADLLFFQRLCTVEGDAFLVYDNQLILYSEEYMEGLAPVQTVNLDADNQPDYTNEQKITSLTVTNGTTSYTYGTDTSVSETVKVPVYIDSEGTAERYAKNLFHYRNEKKKGGIFYTSPLADGYTAGSVAMIKTKNRSSYDGNVFIYHIRHDLANNRTKVFFRCL